MSQKLQTARSVPEDKAYSLGGIDSYVWTPKIQAVRMPMTGTGKALEAILARQFPGADFSLTCHENDSASWIEVAFNAASEIQNKAVSIAAIFNGTDNQDGERTHVLKKIGAYLIDWNVDTIVVNKISAESHRAKDIVTPQLLDLVNRKARRAAPLAYLRTLQNNFA